jgi:hypothetical protein
MLISRHLIQRIAIMRLNNYCQTCMELFIFDVLIHMDRMTPAGL